MTIAARLVAESAIQKSTPTILAAPATTTAAPAMARRAARPEPRRRQRSPGYRIEGEAKSFDLDSITLAIVGFRRGWFVRPCGSREALAELVGDALWIEAEGLGVAANVGAAVDAARPAGAVASLERREHGRGDFGGLRDGLNRDAATLALASQFFSEGSLSVHQEGSSRLAVSASHSFVTVSMSGCLPRRRRRTRRPRAPEATRPVTRSQTRSCSGLEGRARKQDRFLLRAIFYRTIPRCARPPIATASVYTTVRNSGGRFLPLRKKRLRENDLLVEPGPDESPGVRERLFHVTPKRFELFCDLHGIRVVGRLGDDAPGFRGPGHRDQRDLRRSVRIVLSRIVVLVVIDRWPVAAVQGAKELDVDQKTVPARDLNRVRKGGIGAAGAGGQSARYAREARPSRPAK